MLVTFDQHHQIRDLYFPHVGQENHAGHGACRFGVWAQVPRSDGTLGPGRMAWSSDGTWQTRRRYLRDALTTSVCLEQAADGGPGLGLRLYCNDTVDFHRRVYVRRIKLRNLTAMPREVRLVHHQAWHMLGTNVGNTAYFDPATGTVVHYRGPRYISTGFFDREGRATSDAFATGTAGFGHAEGTWRDAEDGHLQGNPIAQGAVDSCIARHVELEPHGEATTYLVILCAESREEMLALHEWLRRQTVEGVLARTTAYWRLWVSGTSVRFGNLPDKYVELFKRSLLIVRTQVDDSGAILAANDSDILQFSRDTYSYVWPRDGALVADALDAAGFPMLSRRFFEFCQRTMTPEGYLHHKYNPDGSVASSWHPWRTADGQHRLPIQEDETALVVWALWRHFERHRDTEFIRPMWVDVVQPAAEFMCAYRHPVTGLPRPSYDLWEERWGVHAFTVAAVWAGLRAAECFARAFGDTERARRYGLACAEIRRAAEAHLYDRRLGRFARRLVELNPQEAPQPASTGQPAAVAGGPGSGEVGGSVRVVGDIEGSVRVEHGAVYGVDEVLDASLWALGHFGMFDAHDPRVRDTMDAVRRRLSVQTAVGGVARYENDYYHRVTMDTARVPGNPWFICTLWLADDLIARASTRDELKAALPVMNWVAEHALESGVLAEQVHPETGAPLSVAPLTWSHAQVVSTAVAYLEKLEQLSTCRTCHQPLFRVRGRASAVSGEGAAGETSAGAVGSAAFGTSGYHEAEPAVPLEMLASEARLPGRGRTLRIDVRDCIGCGVCVATCAGKEPHLPEDAGRSGPATRPGVLVSHQGKAKIDLRLLAWCDADGACVAACPTGVIRWSETAERAA